MERAHALEDGGGRELAYVKMSRAKERSTVYVVADSIDQAREDLRREWGTDRRLSWVIDTGLAIEDPAAVESSRRVARPMRDAIRRGRLVAERDAILAVIPPDPTPQLRAADLQRRRLEREREQLATGEGRYRDHPVAGALRSLRQAESNVARLERNLTTRGASRKEKHRWRSELREGNPTLTAAAREVAERNAPELARLDREEQDLAARLSGLRSQQEHYTRWTALHPEVARRLDHLSAEIDSLTLAIDGPSLSHGRTLGRHAGQAPPAVARDLGLDLGR